MSYSCLEELQVDLDLYNLDKINVLSKVGCKYEDGWLVITDDGICRLFDKDGNLDDIKKVTQLKEKHIRKDIKKIVIPGSVTSIGEGTFDGCSHLISVIIPDSVTNIGVAAFYGCSNLMSITIPNSVTSIEEDAFSWCNSLTNVTIINGVTSIGRCAFFYCKCLTSIMIPESVTSIEDYAFFGCSDLTNLIFEGKTLEEVQSMKNYPFGIKKGQSMIQTE